MDSPIDSYRIIAARIIALLLLGCLVRLMYWWWLCSNKYEDCFSVENDTSNLHPSWYPGDPTNAIHKLIR